MIGNLLVFIMTLERVGYEKKRRTGLERMLRQTDKGEIDYILTKSVSRVSRDTLELLNIIRYLKERGISM